MRLGQKQGYTYLLWLLVGVLILAACQDDPPQTPLADPIQGRENRAATNAAETLQAPTLAAAGQLTQQAQILAQTLEVTLSPTPVFTIITSTPAPTISFDSETDFLGNVNLAKSWMDGVFTGTDGQEYDFNDFAGSVILIEPVTISCSACVFQQLDIRKTAQLFFDENRGYDITYITLNIDPNTSQRTLQNWAIQNKVEASVELNWYVGSASPSLIEGLKSSFGEAILDAESIPLIVVDPTGASHVSRLGTITQYQVRDILMFYTNPLAAIGTATPQFSEPDTSEDVEGATEAENP